MCLPNFKKFTNVPESEALIGYRNWKNPIKDSLGLHSEHIEDYIWKPKEGPHKITEKNSGIYAYNYNNNYYNNNNNNNNYNYYYNYYYYYNNYYYCYNYNNNYNNYNNNNNNNNYYNLFGIIKQWGKVAIHEIGQRSEYAIIEKLFSIRESDAQGPKKFLDWIKVFNERINKIAEKYNCQVISWQDFNEQMK